MSNISKKSSAECKNVNSDFLKFSSLKGKYKPVGRTLLNSEGLKFDWAHSGFTVKGSFEGDVLLKLSAASRVLCAFVVDEDYDTPFIQVAEGDETFKIAEALTKGVHTVTVLKISEPGSVITAKELCFNGTLDNPPSDKALKIEFIGDSVTCSNGLYNEAEQPDNLFRQNTLLGFPFLVGKGLNADISVVSKSGYAVCSPKTGHIMSHYNCSLYGDFEPADAWNFEENKSPDIVFVALGTNDTPQFNSPSGALYGQYDYLKNGIKNTLDIIRSKNPNAVIIWGYEMMATAIADVYESAVLNWSEKNKNAYYLKLTRLDAEGKNGCTGIAGHPNPKCHKNNAEIIVKFIKENILKQ